jgi:hypothetical protein
VNLLQIDRRTIVLLPAALTARDSVNAQFGDGIDHDEPAGAAARGWKHRSGEA